MAYESMRGDLIQAIKRKWYVECDIRIRKSCIYPTSNEENLWITIHLLRAQRLSTSPFAVLSTVDHPEHA